RSGSFVMPRRRRSELLTAGCERPSRTAARDTLCSVSSTCSTRSKEVSSCSRFRSIRILCLIYTGYKRPPWLPMMPGAIFPVHDGEHHAREMPWAPVDGTLIANFESTGLVMETQNIRIYYRGKVHEIAGQATTRTLLQ